MTQILFKDINKEGLHTMKVYEELGGYQSLKKAFAQKPDEIVEAVKASGLRGRGGAGFAFEGGRPAVELDLHGVCGDPARDANVHSEGLGMQSPGGGRGGARDGAVPHRGSAAAGYTSQVTSCKLQVTSDK